MILRHSRVISLRRITPRSKPRAILSKSATFRKRDHNRHLSLQSTVSEELLNSPLDGHVLIFMPGGTEMERCLEDSLTSPATQFTLHGSLDLKDTQIALAPSKAPKIVVSTNIAESSVTIPNIRHVIDSGLERVAVATDGGSMLQTQRITMASARQRAGRAGRTNEVKFTDYGHSQLNTNFLRTEKRKSIGQICCILCFRSFSGAHIHCSVTGSPHLQRTNEKTSLSLKHLDWFKMTGLRLWANRLPSCHSPHGWHSS